MGVPLHILHVTPSYVPMPPVRPVEPPTFRSTGLGILRAADQEARTAAPDVDVHTRLLTGSRVRTLAHESGQGQLLVLGSARRSDFARIWTGATGMEVSAHAACPVVVVPPEWENAEEHKKVVVGFKSTKDAAELLASAFAIAADRRAELVILHAWKLPTAYDDIIESRVAVEEFREHSLGTIEPLVGDLRTAYPDVPVRIEALHAQAAYALVDAAKDADLVLLMRSSHGPMPTHLGRTARAVLRDAGCPVEVLVPGRAAAREQRDFEDSGAARS
jgi:nucleotide-binding universal stress UspA family protein